jgi:hypothetical protein
MTSSVDGPIQHGHRCGHEQCRIMKATSRPKRDDRGGGEFYCPFLPHLKRLFFTNFADFFCLHHTSFASGTRFIIIDTQSIQINNVASPQRRIKFETDPQSINFYANNTQPSNNNNTPNDSCGLPD